MNNTKNQKNPLPGKEPSPTTHARIVGRKEFSVVVYETCAFTFWRTVNPSTGKGWQANRDTTRYDGEKFINRAMFAWLKLSSQR